MFLLAPIVQSLGNFGDINTMPLCYVPFYKSWTSWNKITLDWGQSTTSTQKDPYLASLVISSAQIEDNMNDYIHHIPQWAFMLVLWRDPLRSLCASKWRETSPHQVSANGSPGWHPPPSLPPSSPTSSSVAYVQTGSTSAGAPFLLLFNFAPSTTTLTLILIPLLTVWVNITPYYPFFTVTVFNCIANSHKNQCCEHAHTHIHIVEEIKPH